MGEVVDLAALPARFSDLVNGSPVDLQEVLEAQVYDLKQVTAGVVVALALTRASMRRHPYRLLAPNPERDKGSRVLVQKTMR